MTRSHPFRRPRRAHRIAAVCLGAALLLSGCSHEPGNAFSVGGREVTRSTVDTVVRAQCSLIAASAQQQSQSSQTTQARATLTQTIVSALLQSTIANAYAGAHHTTYDDSTVRRARAQLTAQAAKLPDDQATALTDAVVGVVRGQAVTQAVGTTYLTSRGTAKPTAQQALTAGTAIVRRWGEQQGVHVNPRYDVGPEAAVGAGDGSISVPASAFAKAAVSDSPTSGYLAQLPPGQLCG